MLEFWGQKVKVQGRGGVMMVCLVRSPAGESSSSFLRFFCCGQVTKDCQRVVGPRCLLPTCQFRLGKWLAAFLLVILALFGLFFCHLIS